MCQSVVFIVDWCSKVWVGYVVCGFVPHVSLSPRGGQKTALSPHRVSPGAPPSLGQVEKSLLSGPHCNRIGTFEVNRKWERRLPL